ncbi:MAG: OmpA family protein [Bacteroidales bacterium]|nr:OmpA family protein [Bacteroidales bacterium]MDY0314249.1 OmpA family protein [Bacteroidales bacterium]
MKNIISFLLIMLISFMAFSQELKPDRTNINYFYDAEAFMYENNYNQALDLLLKLDNLSPDNPNVWYKIGVCYLNTRLYKKNALEYLERAAKHTSSNYKENNHKEKNTPLESYLYLGIAYRVNYMFEESLDSFDKLIKMLNPSKPEDKALIKIAKREIQITENAIYNIQNPINAELVNLGEIINSEYTDHSPIVDLHENYLIFTSKRPRDGQALVNQDEDIFISKKVNNKWQEPVRLGAPINTKENNEAAIGLSIDGKQLFFYRSGSNYSGSIYLSESEDMYNWSTPTLLKENVNSRFRETHAAISPDGNSIFFTSNRKGGFGGLDIYVMRKLPNGKWSEALVLPKQINTEYDEESPFIHPDGITLYFSSKGHSSMGGYDVFSSIMSKDGKFTEPVNIGYPINTPDDDVSYILNLDGQKGYIATIKDEDSFGDLDLYEILQEGVYMNNMIVFEGLVTDENNSIPENVTITLKHKDSEEAIEVSRLNKTNGKYLLMMIPDNTYEIYYEAQGHIIHSVEYTPTRKELSKISEEYKPIELEPVVLKSFYNHAYIYFNENTSNLDDNAINLLNDVITKHTDFKSKNEKFAINIVIPKYGSDPLYDEKRSEEITKYLNNKGIATNDIYTNNLFIDDFTNIYGLEIVENKEILAVVEELEEETDKSIVKIENILFDFDKFNIKSEYFENLDLLAEYLNENPTAQIEIGGHTDWLGSGEYNYLLSYHRSKTVKDYLVGKGNNSENIITAKYGKDKPIAANQTLDGRDNPAGRKYNRRAEFKVLVQGNKSTLEINPLLIEDGDYLDISKIHSSKKFTIQIFALKNQKPLEEFSELVGVKMQVSDDGWYRYYLGEYTSFRMATEAAENLKSMGYNTLIRKLSFYEE